jgi:chitinase
MPRIRHQIRIVLAGLALCLPALCCAQPAAPSTAVVAYVFPQNNALQPGDIDARSLTRINYAFANIDNGRMVPGFSKDQENLAFLTALKRQNPSLTVLVSVGGWLWSTNFSDVSLTRQSREIFIQSVMEFLAKYELDGLDIDWEYPGMPGAGHPFRSEDKRNFTLLLQELRARFDAETGRTHKKLYLTIAAGASDEFLAHTEMNKVQRYLDTVNLMAYDYYEPGSDALTGHHAPLFTNPADPKQVSSDTSVRAFERAGVPAAKLLLGLPFYGHIWGQVADRNHGLYQPGKPVPGAYSNYGAIVSTMLNHGFDRYWDSSASVPYLYSPEKQIFVSYEDPESVAAKCSYVLAHKLGGVMFWDYSGDPSGALLQAIQKSLVQGSSPAPAKGSASAK